MKLAIIGLPGSGKTTLFNALTRGYAAISVGGRSREANIGVVKVPDDRVDLLSTMYEPQKTIYAHVEYVDVGGFDSSGEKDKPLDEKLWNLVRPADAIVLVARNFEIGGIAPAARSDIGKVESELRLADLIVVEKRLARIEEDKKRGRKINEGEYNLLSRCLTALEEERPLRSLSEIASSPLLKGFALLSAKPILWIISNGEKYTKVEISEAPPNTMVTEVCGQLEMELAQLSPEESEVFRGGLEVNAEPALQRIIRYSYALLGLVSFFTVGKDEVRAWTITKGTPAQTAAGVIHSDIEKGFIRAEVLAYDDLVEFGSYAQAQKKGRIRLEGRDYIVQDGDIINFRFNV
jgi:GTP-binding protein YchF